MDILPNGNYYFTISKYNDSYVGSLTAKGQYGEFTFKTIDIVKIIAQSNHVVLVWKKMECLIIFHTYIT